MAKTKSKPYFNKNNRRAYKIPKNTIQEKPTNRSFLDKMATLPLASKITFLSGSLVMILGLYGLFQPKTPVWVYVSTQVLLSIMFCSMGYREMKRNTGRNNYIMLYVGAALCLGVAMKYLGLF